MDLRICASSVLCGCPGLVVYYVDEGEFGSILDEGGAPCNRTLALESRSTTRGEICQHLSASHEVQTL